MYSISMLISLLMNFLVTGKSARYLHQTKIRLYDSDLCKKWLTLFSYRKNLASTGHVYPKLCSWSLDSFEEIVSLFNILKWFYWWTLIGIKPYDMYFNIQLYFLESSPLILLSRYVHWTVSEKTRMSGSYYSFIFLFLPADLFCDAKT